MHDQLIQHIGNITWIAVICLISVGLGRLVLLRSAIRDSDSGEYIIFSAAAGFAILDYGIFILAISQALYSTVIYIFTAVCSVLALGGWFGVRNSALVIPIFSQLESCETTQSTGRLVATVNRCCFVLLAISLMACMLLSLTPEIGKDALIYHLGVPKMFLEHHGIHFIPGNIFAHYPLFGEMLYIWGLSISGEVTAKGINFATALLILFTMWKFSSCYLPENHFAPLSLLLFFTIPSVFQNAHVAYCDLFLTFYTFVAMYAYLNWLNSRESLWLMLCGVFCGIAMSIKFAGLFVPLIGSVGILWGCKRQRLSNKKALHGFSIYVLFAFIAGAPFYLKTWIMTGNPLYPLFHHIFGGRGWSEDQARYYEVFIEQLGMGREIFDYLLLPWNLSFHAQMNSPSFDGLIGPLFILLLPFAIFMRGISVELKTLWLYCLIAFVLWASSAQQIRYLLPLFPFLALMAGHIFSYFRNRKAIFALLALFIALGLGFNGYHIINDFNRINPLSVLMGREDKSTFLSRLIPSYEMIRHVNTQLSENVYVLLIYMKNPSYLLHRPFYSDSMFESYTIESILNHSKTPEDVCAALQKKGFTHLLYDIHYIFGRPATLSEKNKELFLEFQKRYLKLVNSEKKRYFLYRLEGSENTPRS